MFYPSNQIHKPQQSLVPNRIHSIPVQKIPNPQVVPFQDLWRFYFSERLGVSELYELRNGIRVIGSLESPPEFRKIGLIEVA